MPIDISEPSLTRDLAITAVAAIGLAAGAEYLPKLAASLADGDGLTLLNLTKDSAVPTLADFNMAMAKKGLSIEATGSGAGLADSAAVPSFSDLQAAVDGRGLKAEDILASQTRENYINGGAFSNVYQIPDLPQYVLRVPNDYFYGVPDVALVDGKVVASPFVKPEGLELKAVEDLAPDKNFGQVVAKVGPAEVLKGLPGEAYGTVGDEEALEAERAESLGMAASMPQEAYDHFAAQLKAAEESGLKFDSMNPNNILVDSEGQLFHPTDFAPYSQEDSYPASLNDMLLPLTHPEGLPEVADQGLGAQSSEVAGSGSSSVTNPLQEELATIVDKSFNAASKAGLTMREDPELDQIFSDAGVSRAEYVQMSKALNARG